MFVSFEFVALLLMFTLCDQRIDLVSKSSTVLGLVERLRMLHTTQEERGTNQPTVVLHTVP